MVLSNILLLHGAAGAEPIGREVLDGLRSALKGGEEPFPEEALKELLALGRFLDQDKNKDQDDAPPAGPVIPTPPTEGLYAEPAEWSPLIPDNIHQAQHVPWPAFPTMAAGMDTDWAEIWGPWNEPGSRLPPPWGTGLCDPSICSCTSSPCHGQSFIVEGVPPRLWEIKLQYGVKNLLRDYVNHDEAKHYPLLGVGWSEKDQLLYGIAMGEYFLMKNGVFKEKRPSQLFAIGGNSYDIKFFDYDITSYAPPDLWFPGFNWAAQADCPPGRAGTYDTKTNSLINIRHCQFNHETFNPQNTIRVQAIDLEYPADGLKYQAMEIPVKFSDDWSNAMSQEWNERLKPLVYGDWRPVDWCLDPFSGQSYVDQNDAVIDFTDIIPYPDDAALEDTGNLAPDGESWFFATFLLKDEWATPEQESMASSRPDGPWLDPRLHTYRSCFDQPIRKSAFLQAEASAGPPPRHPPGYGQNDGPTRTHGRKNYPLFNARLIVKHDPSTRVPFAAELSRIKVPGQKRQNATSGPGHGLETPGYNQSTGKNNHFEDSIISIWNGFGTTTGNNVRPEYGAKLEHGIPAPYTGGGGWGSSASGPYVMLHQGSTCPNHKLMQSDLQVSADSSPAHHYGFKNKNFHVSGFDVTDSNGTILVDSVAEEMKRVYKTDTWRYITEAHFGPGETVAEPDVQGMNFAPNLRDRYDYVERAHGVRSDLGSAPTLCALLPLPQAIGQPHLTLADSFRKGRGEMGMTSSSAHPDEVSPNDKVHGTWSKWNGIYEHTRSHFSPMAAACVDVRTGRGMRLNYQGGWTANDAYEDVYDAVMDVGGSGHGTISGTGGPLTADGMRWDPWKVDVIPDDADGEKFPGLKSNGSKTIGLIMGDSPDPVCTRLYGDLENEAEPGILRLDHCKLYSSAQDSSVTNWESTQRKEVPGADWPYGLQGEWGSPGVNCAAYRASYYLPRPVDEDGAWPYDAANDCYHRPVLAADRSRFKKSIYLETEHSPDYKGGSHSDAEPANEIKGLGVNWYNRRVAKNYSQMCYDGFTRMDLGSRWKPTIVNGDWADYIMPMNPVQKNAASLATPFKTNNLERRRARTNCKAQCHGPDAPADVWDGRCELRWADGVLANGEKLTSWTTKPLHLIQDQEDPAAGKEDTAWYYGHYFGLDSMSPMQPAGPYGGQDSAGDSYDEYVNLRIPPTDWDWQANQYEYMEACGFANVFTNLGRFNAGDAYSGAACPLIAVDPPAPKPWEEMVCYSEVHADTGEFTTSTAGRPHHLLHGQWSDDADHSNHASGPEYNQGMDFTEMYTITGHCYPKYMHPWPLSQHTDIAPKTSPPAASLHRVMDLTEDLWKAIRGESDEKFNAPDRCSDWAEVPCLGENQERPLCFHRDKHGICHQGRQPTLEECYLHDPYPMDPAATVTDQEIMDFAECYYAWFKQLLGDWAEATWILPIDWDGDAAALEGSRLSNSEPVNQQVNLNMMTLTEQNWKDWTPGGADGLHDPPPEFEALYMPGPGTVLEDDKHWPGIKEYEQKKLAFCKFDLDPVQAPNGAKWGEQRLYMGIRAGPRRGTVCEAGSTLPNGGVCPQDGIVDSMHRTKKYGFLSAWMWQPLIPVEKYDSMTNADLADGWQKWNRRGYGWELVLDRQPLEQQVTWFELCLPMERQGLESAGQPWQDGLELERKCQPLRTSICSNRARTVEECDMQEFRVPIIKPLVPDNEEHGFFNPNVVFRLAPDDRELDLNTIIPMGQTFYYNLNMDVDAQPLCEDVLGELRPPWVNK